MNRTALVVALIVALGLGGYVWYVKSSDASSSRDSIRLHEPVLLVPREALREIEVVRQGGLSALFRRGEDAWEVVSGPDGTDPERIPDVLYAWSLVRAVDRVDGADGLATYGLEPPSLRIRTVSAGGETTSLDLGRQSPLGSQFYAVINDRAELYVVDEQSVNLLAEVDIMLALAEDPSYLR